MDDGDAPDVQDDMFNEAAEKAADELVRQDQLFMATAGKMILAALSPEAKRVFGAPLPTDEEFLIDVQTWLGHETWTPEIVRATMAVSEAVLTIATLVSERLNHGGWLEGESLRSPTGKCVPPGYFASQIVGYARIDEASAAEFWSVIIRLLANGQLTIPGLEVVRDSNDPRPIIRATPYST